MIKKTAFVLGVAVLCAIAFAGGYVRGKYVEAHTSVAGIDIQYWDEHGNLHPTGYQAFLYDRAERLIIAGIPRECIPPCGDKVSPSRK